MKKWFRYSILPAMALVAVFGVAGCGDDDDNGGTDAGVDAGADAGEVDGGGMDGGDMDGGGEDGGMDGGAETAQVRVIHLSPDAPAVDVYVEGDTTPVVENLDFTSSTDYLDLDPGTYTFQVTATGDTPENAVLTIPDLTVEAGQAFTAAAFDEVANLQALALEDDPSEPAAGSARLRAVHTAVGLGPVDVTISNADGSVSQTIEQLDFGEAADAVEVPAGSYDIDIDVDADGTPDVSFAAVPVSDGTNANVFALTDADGNPFLLAQLQGGVTLPIQPGGAGGQANLRAIHLSPDAPAVDVYVATDPPTLAIENLAFGESSAYQALPPGTYEFLVVPNGADATDSANVVLDLAGLELMADSAYTAAAYGEATSDPATLAALLLDDDVTPPDSGNGRVTPVHAAVGLADVAVDVYETSAPTTPIVEDLAFGQVGPTLDLPAGSYSLGFDADNDPTTFEAIFDVELLDGQILNGFAVTDAAGDLGLYLQDQNADGAVPVVAPTAP